MSSESEAPATGICSHGSDDVFIRGKSLCKELIGQRSFTEMIYFQVLGRMPTADQAALLDACLVALMEHGLTPSVLAARLTYSSAPEAVQGAVAAGLLGVGSRFVGSMEGCAALLQRITVAEDGEAEAKRIAVEHRAQRTPLPGFGHPTHKPDDPRAQRLLELAKSRKVARGLGVAARALAQELLHAAVLQRVERDHRKPPAGREQAHRRTRRVLGAYRLGGGAGRTSAAEGDPARRGL